MKQEVARELFDLIQGHISKGTIFILLLQESENGGMVSNIDATPEVIAKVLVAMAEHLREPGRPANHTREADGTEHEARGRRGH